MTKHSAGFDPHQHVLKRCPDIRTLLRMYDFPDSVTNPMPMSQRNGVVVMLFSHRGERRSALPAAIYEGDTLVDIPMAGLIPSERTDLPFPFEIRSLRQRHSMLAMVDLAQGWIRDFVDHPLPRRV